jgi:hypothetical protein
VKEVVGVDISKVEIDQLNHRLGILKSTISSILLLILIGVILEEKHPPTFRGRFVVLLEID